jgi:hypothetical protein
MRTAGISGRPQPPWPDWKPVSTSRRRIEILEIERGTLTAGKRTIHERATGVNQLKGRAAMGPVESAYQILCRKPFALPGEEQVAALEQRIGVSLPDEYRRFILQHNGGWFNEPQIVPPSDESPEDRLTVLYGIGASHPSAELARARDLALFDDNDPPEVLPIGDTIMGNLLLLITHPEDNGSIVLKIAFSDECHFLAVGIEEFFPLLREPTD